MDTMDIYEDYLLAKQLQGLSPTTLERYEYSVKRLLTDLDKRDIADITAADIRRWLGTKTYSDTSRGIDIKNQKAFFRWAKREGYREDNPMARIPMPKTSDPEKRALDEAELSKLIETARKSGKRDLAIILTLVDTGMRASELGALERHDLDLDQLTVRIRCGKGGKERVAFISPLTNRAIRRYLASRRDSDPALFLTNRGIPFSRDSLRLLLYRLSLRAGIGKVGPHCIRHSFATFLARQGCDAWSMQSLLGHADNKVCLRYIHLSGRDIQEAHKRYSPVALVMSRGR
jgi:site-specific recombinase XerD